MLSTFLIYHCNTVRACQTLFESGVYVQSEKGHLIQSEPRSCDRQVSLTQEGRSKIGFHCFLKTLPKLEPFPPSFSQSPLTCSACIKSFKCNWLGKLVGILFYGKTIRGVFNFALLRCTSSFNACAQWWLVSTSEYGIIERG